MEFEDILVEVGDYGNYQRNLVYVFLGPSSALLPWFFMNVLFLVSAPDHWCKVDELDAWNLTLEQQHLLIRPPNDRLCSMYVLNYTELFSSPTWNWTIPENTTTMSCPNGWNYDKSNYETTSVTQWDMVCQDSHYASFVLTMASVGAIIGTPLYGAMSDMIGRKPTFFLTVVVASISGIASVLMTNFTLFVVLRTINGSIMPSIFQVPFIILLEIVGPTMRTRMNVIANCSWTFGLCWLPLIAWLSRDWVIFGLVTSSVTLIYLLYWKFLPESPRWLITRERYEESADILTEMAKKNKKPHTREEIMNLVKKVGDRMKKEKEMKKKGDEASVMDIIKNRHLRKYFIVITSLWIACGAAYYGLQINVSNLDGNEFLNFFILAIVEVPGFFVAWYIMEKVGRRWCSVSTMLMTGIALLIPVFVSEPGVYPSIIGKFGSSAAFMAMYQQSSELYPTVVRALGMGLSGTISTVVTIAVPYIVYLAEYGKYIPFLIFALICIIASVEATFLPETLNESLPQTIVDAENFANSQSYFSCNRRRRPSCYDQRPSVQYANGEDFNNPIELKNKIEP